MTRFRAQDGPLDVRLIAIRVDLQTIYRFVFLTPPSLTKKLSVGLRRTTHSFRLLDPPEVMSLRPCRLEIIRVGPGDTVASLARRMPYEDFALERFRVLNGLGENERLAVGRRVKMIVE